MTSDVLLDGEDDGDAADEEEDKDDDNIESDAMIKVSELYCFSHCY